ncbi:hypothetical protein Hdeb2414_s0011g00372151 [Helianthus debilis subsp. tardiflorus]
MAVTMILRQPPHFLLRSRKQPPPPQSGVGVASTSREEREGGDGRETEGERERNRRSTRLLGGLLNFPVVNDTSPTVQDLIRQVSDRVRVGFGSDLVMVQSGYGSSCGSGFGSVRSTSQQVTRHRFRLGSVDSGPVQVVDSVQVDLIGSSFVSESVLF